VVAAVLALGSLTLAGCGSGQQPSAGEAVAASAPKSWDCSPSSTLSQAEWTEHCAGVDNSKALESSVTTADGAFIQYPNGLRGQVIAVKARANDADHTTDGHPEFDEMVTVTFQLSNTGTVPVQLNTDALGPSQLDLYYGQNRYQANGWMTDPHGIADLPKQLNPDTKASFDQEFTLPSSGLEALVLTFHPDVTYPPHTFTDVQTLIH
jgi:hypothetical protein